MDTDQRLLSTEDAAEIIGVKPRYVRRLRLHGRIPAVKVGRQYVYYRDDVEEFAAIPRLPGWPKGLRRQGRRGKALG